ncbi:MAG: FHA domain-containing protein [Anaerolineae bacterium]|nr:FHA domain-containing protein [Anaerolineae bacterium]
MTSPKLFLLYAPIDTEWAQGFHQQLREAGYTLYMEPPESDPEDAILQRKTAAALQKATHLLAVVSKESALGESAAAFEAWWRPFLRTGRPVIACIVPDAPPGAEHWMPFDLLRQRRADFREPDGMAQLQKWIGPAPSAASESLPISEPLSSRADAVSRAARPEPTPRPIAATPRRPPTPSKPKPAEEPLPPRPKPTFLRMILNTIGILIGLVLVVLLLFAASQSGDSTTGGISAEAWLVSLLIVVVAVALIGRIVTQRQRRQWRLEQRRQMAQTRANIETEEAAKIPEVYLEVIQSKAKRDVGQIWPMDDFALTVGRGVKVDVPLRDRAIARRQCMVFLDDETGRYYLENLDVRERTVFYDKPLLRGEVVPIENGDMIRLGKSVVLQFRA